MKNYYNILGISDDASLQVISEAYKKLAFKFHPDKNAGDPFFDHWFKEINEAKQILSDEEERAEYDFKLNNYSDAYELIKQQQAQENYDRVHKRKRFIKTKARNKKFFAASAFVVVLAGLFFIFSEADGEEYRSSEKTVLIAKMESTESVEDTEPGNALTMKNEDELIKEEEKKETDNLFKPIATQVVKAENEAINPISPKTTSSSEVKQEETMTTSTNAGNERALTDIEVSEILRLLRGEQGKNCVQIVQSSTSKIKPDFAIAHVLQQHGYIITGREISKSVKQGILVEKNGDCIKLYIGN